MNYIKTLWKETNARYGRLIEGAVDWSLKYLRIWFCLSATMFLVAVTIVVRAFIWACQNSTTSSRDKKTDG